MKELANESMYFILPPTERLTTHLLVSPALAEAWLLLNTENRQPKITNITRMASDMRSGRWDNDNGESLKFSKSGRLIDGQNRLKACVESGCSFGTNVCFGLPDKAQETIDLGTPRSTADVLAFEGVRCSKQLAAAAKLIMIHDTIGFENLSNSFRFPSKPEILEKSREYLEDLQRSLLFGREQLMPAASATALHFLFARQNEASANAFFEDLRTGMHLGEFSPVRLLRERLLLERANSRHRLDQKYMFALCFNAWIAYRDGLPMKTLRWRADGPRPEPFPDINKGWNPESQV